MAVEHIHYKNKKLPVKLGYYALKMLQKDKGVGMEALESDLSLYEPLLFYSLEQGHRVNKKEFSLTMEDMVDVLDDCFFEFVSLIPKFFPVDLEKMMATGGKTGS